MEGLIFTVDEELAVLLYQKAANPFGWGFFTLHDNLLQPVPDYLHTQHGMVHVDMYLSIQDRVRYMNMEWDYVPPLFRPAHASLEYPHLLFSVALPDEQPLMPWSRALEYIQANIEYPVDKAASALKHNMELSKAFADLTRPE